MSKIFYCPCGYQGKLYSDCCGLVHGDIRNAVTAEQLMRSRYSAFVLCDGEFLLRSHAQLFRSPTTMHNTIRWARSVAWNRLEIISRINGGENDTHGMVEFNAFFKEKNKLQCIHEISEFVRENGHWVYTHEIDKL